ncbi:DUF6544 family protein [Exiguobacterium flavidum]|uniref:DUF6544 family protein n=1 Tax=Exiguobacterium flavidum TaxID=2184695 RepID=UPI000DF839B1|nr:DUF6544 family protein [Exiguobacterium flavidum]
MRRRHLLFLIPVLGLILFYRSIRMPVCRCFQKTVDSRIRDAAITDRTIEETDLEDLPKVVKRYFHANHYVGAQFFQYSHTLYFPVSFILNGDKRIKMDYEHYNFIAGPERFARMTTSLYGLPFEGVDAYQAGIGEMVGRLGGVIPMFDVKGREMDQSALVTCLAESIFLPSFLLSPNITWTELDDHRARAELTQDGLSVKGTFTFNEHHELIRFETEDRYMEKNGEFLKIPWVVSVTNHRAVKGLKFPTRVTAAWITPDGRQTYFDGRIRKLTLQ